MIQDLRFALRTLLKTPAFTLVAVMTLALGIGGNTAIFSAAEGIWLRPLPFTDTSGVMLVSQRSPESSYWPTVPAATYHEWRDHSHSFSILAAYSEKTGNLTGASIPQRVQAASVDDGLFALLNMKPQLGRTFAGDDFQPGHGVAVISNGLWQSQFGGSADVVGKTIQLDGRAVTVIGVMAKVADFPAATDLWLPLSFTPQEWSDTKAHRVHPLGVLRAGVSRPQALAELDQLLGNVAQKSPRDFEGIRAALFPLGDVINGNMTPGFLRVLLGAAGFVLLIACINLGNLQLARASGRRREFSLRAALGCSRGRLARQMLTESMVLALAGAAVGLLIANWAVRLMATSMPPDTARQISGWTTMSIDGRVLAFTIAAAVISGLLAGLVPVARGYKFAPAEALKSGSTATPGASQRLRAMLVVGEAAVALMLLVGTVLVVQGFRHMIAVANSFDPAALLTMQVELPPAKYPTPATKTNFYQQALQNLRAVPGVTDAALFSAPPFNNNGVDWYRFRTTAMTDTRHLPGAILQTVSPGFFRALRIPLQRGRDFSDSDGPDSLPVAIISEVMARRTWPRESPVGQTVFLREGKTETPLRVVGIAAPVEFDWTDNAPEAVIYVPYRQRPQAAAYLAARSGVPAATLAPEIRDSIGRLDPDLPLSNMKTLDRVMLESLAPLVQIGGLMSSFGLIALLLAAAGIYGLVSYAVEQRTQEIGIRMAVGAEAGDVVRLIVGQMMRFALLGIGIGLVGAFALGRLVAGFFFGAKAGDPVAFSAAVALLLGMALLASFGPARRATHVDPMKALRAE